MNLNSYKATFLIDTRENSETTEAVIDSLKEVIKAATGETSQVEDLGVRDFARCPNTKFTLGRYLQFDIQGAPQTPAMLHQKVRLNKIVNRVLVERL